MKQALTIQPGHIPARINLVRRLCARGERDEGRTILEPLLACDGATAKTNFLAGTIDETGGQFSQALGHYQNALQRDPSFDKAINNIGITQLGLQDYEAARATFGDLFSKNRGTGRDQSAFNAGDWSIHGHGSEHAAHGWTTSRYICDTWSMSVASITPGTSPQPWWMAR